MNANQEDVVIATIVGLAVSALVNFGTGKATKTLKDGEDFRDIVLESMGEDDA